MNEDEKSLILPTAPTPMAAKMEVTYGRISRFALRSRACITELRRPIGRKYILMGAVF